MRTSKCSGSSWFDREINGIRLQVAGLMSLAAMVSTPGF
jgi:hypothetical protein